MVNRNGQSYWVPVNDSIAINNYAKWELAFRVYIDIYSRAHPLRLSELIQYKHITHTISSQFVWENVCDYDKDFRIHMARHSRRNWGIILQQAWSMRLRDRIHSMEVIPSGSGGRTPRSKGNYEICRKFNRGKCSFSFSCKYDHRCTYCYKFGHAVLNCRKAAADKDRNEKDKSSRMTENGHPRMNRSPAKGDFKRNN